MFFLAVLGLVFKVFDLFLTLYKVKDESTFMFILLPVDIQFSTSVS